MPLRALLLITVLTGSLCGQQAQDNSDDREKITFFEESVRPILIKNCVQCHGQKKQESGLRVDQIESMLKGGDTGPALIPDTPDESLIVDAIEYSSGLEMPPSKKLSDHEISAIKKWIRDGAHWPKTTAPKKSRNWSQHWAFRTVRATEPPKITAKGYRIQNEIDQFIAKRLIDLKLPQSNAADDFTFVRRAYYDLHGLGPTFEQANKFIQDQRPDRIQRLLDELLKAPRYGEMQARNWMDVARYADNKGYVFFEDKNYPWAFTYRDWLIRAFNEDMPYDQFIVNQLAADYAKSAQANLPALGFLTVGAKFANNVHDQIDDRIDVVMRGLMGLTVSCARCHDHKFDPVPQADYYSLYGVFRSCYEPMVLPTFEREPAHKEYIDYKNGLENRLKDLDSFVVKQRNLTIDGARKRIAEYLMAVHKRRHHPSTENFMTITDKGSIIPKVISRYESYLNQAKKENNSIWRVWHIYSELDDDSFKTNASKAAKEIAGLPKSSIHPIVLSRFHSLIPKDMNEVALIYGEIFREIAGQYEKNATNLTEDQKALADVLYGNDSPASLPRIMGWGFLDLIPDRPTQAEYQKLVKEVESFCKSGAHAPPRAMVLLDADDLYEPFIFLRGNPNRKGKSVKRQFLTSIPNTEKIKTEFPDNQSGRLQLAHSIASKDNPLTARVIVNRIWRQHFGTGIVATPSDFGVQGVPPTHPQLLDWLANWFMDNDWSIKKLHRLIMTSETYRQSSLENDQQKQIDPGNKYYSRVNRRRVEFEPMRDSLLSVTGTLTRKIGGKSFNLFSGFTPRRSLYGFIDRMDVPGVLRSFDFPEASATSAQREQTTVPAQALFFLNHDLVNQCAEKVLQRPDVLSAKQNEDKIIALYRCVFSRNPSAVELELAKRYLRENKTQTPNAWKYGYGSCDENANRVSEFGELKHFTGTRWQGGPALPDPKLNWVYHKKGESHPGASMKLCAVRRWIAPNACTIQIAGLLKHEPTQGNGVRSRIISSRGGVLGTWTVHNSQAETSVDQTDVIKGDTIDFVSDFKGDISHDQHLWSIKISTQGKNNFEWDSMKQFKGKQNSKWVSYVHALLMTNEFVFID